MDSFQEDPTAGDTHPARHALVEIVNVHDDGLLFEPIHRVLFGVKEDFLEKMQAFFPDCSVTECADQAEMVAKVQGQVLVLFGSLIRMRPLRLWRQEGEQHVVGVILPGKILAVAIPPSSNLPVGSVQPFLDAFMVCQSAIGFSTMQCV